MELIYPHLNLSQVKGLRCKIPCHPRGRSARCYSDWRIGEHRRVSLASTNLNTVAGSEPSTLARLLQNVAWFFAGRVWRTMVALIIGCLIARYLGVAQFGVLAFALTFIDLFSVLALLGLKAVVIREIAREPARSNELLGSAFFLQAIGGVIFLSAALFTYFVFWDSEPARIVLVIVSGGRVLFTGKAVFEYWFNAQLQSRHIVVATGAAQLVAFVAQILLILFAAPLWTFAAALLLQAGIETIFLIVIYTRTGESIRRWRVCWATVGKLLRESWPLIAAGLSASLLVKIDTIMLAAMVSDAEVGIYAVAAKMSLVWKFAGLALCASALPILSRTHASDSQAASKHYQTLCDGLLCVAFAIATVVSLTSPLLVHWLFGPEYHRSALVLTIHIWSVLFIFQRLAHSNWLTVKNQQHIWLIVVIASGLLNFVLNLLVIPHYGAPGAAFATLATVICTVLFFPLFLASTRECSVATMKSFLLPIRLLSGEDVQLMPLARRALSHLPCLRSSQNG